MQTPFKSYSVQWMIGDRLLTDPQVNTRYATDDLYRVQYPLPPEIGQGGFTSIQLSSGLSLHHSRFEFAPQRDVSRHLSASVEMDMNEPSLLVTSVLAGGFTRLDQLRGLEQQMAPKRTLIQWTDRIHSAMRFGELPLVEVLYLRASQSSLQGLMGHELTTRIEHLVNLADPLVSLPRSVTAPLAFCFDYRLEGSLHKLHAQTKALEFLEGLIRYFEARGLHQAVKPEHRAQAVHDLIRQQPANLPTTAELAKRFGLSAKTLNGAFMREYGMSVAQFIKEHRLTLAHEQIANSTLPIREIAARLGYSQMSNFSAVFKSFYGYSPSTLRQQVWLHACK